MFDFTNYTFSGLLALVSAVFGISYPLILDSIARLDEKYGGTIIMQSFLHEKRYLIFRWLLVINLLIAVVVPFVLYVYSVNHALLVSQTAAVILLIFSSFTLYQLILEYQVPKNLDMWVVKHHEKTVSTVLLQNELALYLSRRDDDELFWKVWGRVRKYIYEKLVNLKENDDFPNEIAKILFRQRGMIGKFEGTPSRFYLTNVVTPILYSTDKFLYPCIEKHQILWRLLNDAVIGDNKEWILQHWSWMDNYYRFCLRYIDFDEREKTQHREFVFVSCVMLGGLLLFHKRYNVINELLFYTNVLPPEYPLLPNSLTEIEDRILVLDKYKDCFLFLESNFYFSKLNSGVQNDGHIYSMGIDFLSLCLIRLWSLQAISLYQNSLVLPTSPSEYNKICRSLQIVKLLNVRIGNWYRNDVFGKFNNLKSVEQNHINGILDNWINCLESTKLDKEHHPNVASDKVKDFKDELVEASEKKWRKLPERSEVLENEENLMVDSSVEFVRELLDVKQFDKGFCITSLNLADVLVNALQRPTVAKYLELLQTNISNEFKIQYRDIFKALESLNVNKEFVIVNAGIYLGQYEAMYGITDGFVSDQDRQSYRGAYIYDIDCKLSKLYVVSKEELPFVEYVVASPNSGLTPIGSNTVLCSNIDELLDENFHSDRFLMCLSRGVKIYSLKDGFKCVCLNITHDVSQGKMDLEKVSW